MKTATARDLRYKTSDILKEVRRGREVTVTLRGKRIAVLRPVEQVEHKELNPVGFGMWKDRGDLRNVGQWVEECRKSRYRR